MKRLGEVEGRAGGEGTAVEGCVREEESGIVRGGMNVGVAEGSGRVSLLRLMGGARGQWREGGKEEEGKEGEWKEGRGRLRERFSVLQSKLQQADDLKTRVMSFQGEALSRSPSLLPPCTRFLSPSPLPSHPTLSRSYFFSAWL